MSFSESDLFAAYLVGYLGAPLADDSTPLEREAIELLAVYALGVYQRSVGGEPEGLAAVVGKVKTMLAPSPSSAAGDVDWFRDPGAHPHRAKGTR
jgi:hypothetical protein